uniref:Uncharacterized protein n=1 Tax=Nelumbo nucifera TaxID=4432 RepID=A0A822ZLG2_NELNU|nr:TPA_asm: hypothetical protein HUJ06_000818 [Nelumbo nucifera]
MYSVVRVLSVLFSIFKGIVSTSVVKGDSPSSNCQFIMYLFVL